MCKKLNVYFDNYLINVSMFFVDWINNVYALIICARIEIDAKNEF